MPERSLDVNPRCPACGSDAIVPDVVVEAAMRQFETVHVVVNTGTRRRRRLEGSEARCRACSDCGFVMLFADDPSKLWEANLDRLANDD